MTSNAASKNAERGQQTPRIHVNPPRVDTYGDMAADFAAAFKLTLDPWQRTVLDDWLAVDETGEWAARTCGIACPRQNGKNAIVEAREIFGAVHLGERILHTAHEVKTAKKHFRRLMYFFGKQVNDPRAKFPELNRLVTEVRRVNGEETITLSTGGSIEMAARTKSSSRGYSVDLVIYDEAQQFTEDALEALNSTNSASDNPQWIYLGTPPGPNAQGDIWIRLRQTALSGEASALTYAEWSIEGQLGIDFDIHDHGVWVGTNPAYGYRVQQRVFTDELSTMSPAGFARERLGWWGPGDDGSSDQLFPVDDWEDLVSEGPPDGTRPDALAVDMSHDRLIAIAACWLDGEKAHVELVAVDYTIDTLSAVEWIAERARHLVPVIIDAWSPAAALVAPLKQRRVKVTVTSSGSEMSRACGLFFDELTAGRLTHAAQHQLTHALAGAKRRPIGDAGGFGVNRRDPDQNIAPLVAAILARYGASLKRKSGQGRVAHERTASSRRAVVS